jgi:hypothetical protein
LENGRKADVKILFPSKICGKIREKAAKKASFLGLFMEPIPFLAKKGGGSKGA